MEGVRGYVSIFEKLVADKVAEANHFGWEKEATKNWIEKKQSANVQLLEE